MMKRVPGSVVSRWSGWSVSWAGAALLACAACSGASTTLGGDNGTGDGGTPGNGSNPDGSTSSAQDSGVIPGVDASSAHDAGSHAGDASSAPDAWTPPPPPPPDPADGTPTRQQCTGTFGSGLSATHGRLDGLLVSIVSLGGTHSCNGDSSHVHLQVLMSGAVYDIAVNSDTLVAERDLTLPDGTWSEGWHTSDGLDYAALGLHSSDFAMPSSPSALAQQIEKELATANHISVFATGYGSNGAHLVHRNGGGRDGALVIHPLAAPAHIMMFTFTTSSPF